MPLSFFSCAVSVCISCLVFLKDSLPPPHFFLMHSSAGNLSGQLVASKALQVTQPSLPPDLSAPIVVTQPEGLEYTLVPFGCSGENEGDGHVNYKKRQKCDGMIG